MTSKNDQTSPPPADDPRDELAAFSIGAADREESLAVKHLLAERPALRREAAEYAAAASLLNAAVPRVEPPSALKSKIMAAARATRPAAPHLTVLPKSDLSHDSRQPGRTRGVLIWLTTTAAVVLLGLNVFWILQVSKMRSEQDAVTVASADFDMAVALFTDADSHRVELMDGDGSMRAMVVFTPAHHEAIMVTHELPALGEASTYQLWAIDHAGNMVSAGMFDTDPDGVFSMMFEAPMGWNSISGLGISVEPPGGSEQPTTAPLAMGMM